MPEGGIGVNMDLEGGAFLGVGRLMKTALCPEEDVVAPSLEASESIFLNSALFESMGLGAPILLES